MQAEASFSFIFAGETYDELRPRYKVFQDEFGATAFGARAFGISGDRSQHL